MHPIRLALRINSVSSGLILLLVLAIPYLSLNLWRLARGRSWAFTFCQVMKEWDAGQRSEFVAARAAPPSPVEVGSPKGR